jgi:hypothetical protein
LRRRRWRRELKRESEERIEKKRVFLIIMSADFTWSGKKEGGD